MLGKAKMLIAMGVLSILAIIAVQASGSAGDEPETLELLHEARVLIRQGRFDEAAVVASAAIARDGRSVEAYRLRAEANQSRGQFDRAIADWSRCIELNPEESGAYQARGVLHFKTGSIRESIADFDSFLKANPERDPHHWQRGICYYYAGEFDKGVRQFERHRLVNPQDVENAIWHYLCKARVDGVDAAQQELIDISRDSRPWAMEVYRMFQGRVTPQAVIEHAERVSRTEAEKKNNLFYAHLYVGLLHESAGRTDESRKHIELAAEKYPSTHYMGDVARVHRKLRKDVENKKK